MELLLQEIPVSPGIRTIIGLTIILLGTVLASAILKSLVFSLIGKLTRKTSTTLDDRLLTATRTPIMLLVYILGLSLVFNFIEARYSDYISAGFYRVIYSIIYGIGVAIVAILVVKVSSAVLKWYGDTFAVRTETTIDDEFIPLLDRTVKIVIITLAVLIVLDHFGVDVMGLVTILGVGSLAVALAAQDTLANMIGGFTIMIDRPFRANDMVRLPDGRRVVVHEIGIRSTKFLTFDNTLVIVPNAELVKSTVHNITYPRPMVRVVVDVGVGYNSDMKKVREVMLDEAKNHSKVLTDPKPQFFFLNFGDSSLDVSLRCHVARAEDHRLSSSELREQILDRFRSEGIEIPFPQRVVTMVKDGEENELS
ncbi:MAG: mechanosensitive ion channel [candidate division Zixibacteria bacterium]|nr:mechanosensitive ion channel [candidate division Zixibacteria bacterium]